MPFHLMNCILSILLLFHSINDQITNQLHATSLHLIDSLYHVSCIKLKLCTHPHPHASKQTTNKPDRAGVCFPCKYDINKCQQIANANVNIISYKYKCQNPTQQPNNPTTQQPNNNMQHAKDRYLVYLSFLSRRRFLFPKCLSPQARQGKARQGKARRGGTWGGGGEEAH